jgi:hypothetical protein
VAALAARFASHAAVHHPRKLLDVGVLAASKLAERHCAWMLAHSFPSITRQEHRSHAQRLWPQARHRIVGYMAAPMMTAATTIAAAMTRAGST